MVVGDIILAVSAGFSIYHCGGSHINWRIITYGFCFSHGFFGVVNHFTGDDNVQKAKEFTLPIVSIIPLPFMATQLYLNNSMDKHISLIHAASGILPLITNVSDNVRDLIFIGNAASLTFLAIQNDKLWYIGLVLVAALNYFYTPKLAEQMNLPSDQALSVGLGCFCLLAALKVN